MFFTLFLILVCLIALSSSVRAFQALRRMQLLTSNFWKENGLETILLPLLWLMLLAGSAALLPGLPWAKPVLHLTLLCFLVFVWVSGIGQLLKLNKLLRKGSQARNKISKFNLEILQKTGLSFFDPQRIDSFFRGEHNFFISHTDPEDADTEDVEKSRLDAHVRRHFRKQTLATVINIMLATALLWLVWWKID